MICRKLLVCCLTALTLLMNAPALTRLVRSGCRMATSWQSGWFKNEGLIYFGSLAVAVFIVMPRKDLCRLVLRILAAAILPVSWHLGCRFAGASLDGYSLEQIQISQFAAALQRTYQDTFCFAWKYAFIYPISGIAILVSQSQRRSLTILTMGVSFFIIAFAAIFSASDTLDFEWHLNSLERLLWLPSLLLLREQEWLNIDKKDENKLSIS